MLLHVQIFFFNYFLTVTFSLAVRHGSVVSGKYTQLVGLYRALIVCSLLFLTPANIYIHGRLRLISCLFMRGMIDVLSTACEKSDYLNRFDELTM